MRFMDCPPSVDKWSPSFQDSALDKRTRTDHPASGAFLSQKLPMIKRNRKIYGDMEEDTEPIGVAVKPPDRTRGILAKSPGPTAAIF